MALLKAIYYKLEELYGGDVAVRALCISGGIGLLTLALLLKPQQPVIIVNEIIKKED